MAAPRGWFEKAKIIGLETLKGAACGASWSTWMMYSMNVGEYYSLSQPFCELSVETAYKKLHGQAIFSIPLSKVNPATLFAPPPGGCIVPDSDSIYRQASDQYKVSLLMLGSAAGFLSGIRKAFLPDFSFHLPGEPLLNSLFELGVKMIPLFMFIPTGRQHILQDPAGVAIPLDAPIAIEVDDPHQDELKVEIERKLESKNQEIKISSGDSKGNSTQKIVFFPPPKTFNERLSKIEADCESHEIEFKIDIPDAYCCPISNNLMDDPVLFSGTIYDRAQLVKWLSTPRMVGDERLSPLNPRTGLPIPAGKITLMRVTSQIGFIENFVSQQEGLFKKKLAEKLEAEAAKTDVSATSLKKIN